MKESGLQFDFAVLLTVYLPDIISNFPFLSTIQFL